MRVKQSAANVVRITIGVGVAVVNAVASRPPANRALDGAATKGSKKNLKRQASGVGAMGPETVITTGDGDTGHVIVKEGPEGSFAAERSEHGPGTADNRDNDNQRHIEPVDVLVPVLEGEWLLGDVHIRLVSRGGRSRRLGNGNCDGPLAQISLIRLRRGGFGHHCKDNRKSGLGSCSC